MTPCACSMTSLHGHRALLCCRLAQVRGAQLAERHGGVSDSAVVTRRTTSQACSLDNRLNSTRTYSSGGKDGSAWVLKIRGGQSGASVRRKELVRAKPSRKLAVEARYRLQDVVDSGEAVDNGTDKSRRRNRDRAKKKPTGERRKRLQILGNNGMVDLEDQLGWTSPEEDISGEQHKGDIERRFSSRDKDRRLLESSLLKDDIVELKKRQERLASASCAARRLAQSEPEFTVRESSLYDTDASTSKGPTSDGLDEDQDKQLVGRHSSSSDVDENTAVGSIGAENPRAIAELPGGRRVVELVAAWDGLAGRLPPEFSRSSNADLVLRALKVIVTALQHNAPETDRSPWRRALAVAHILVDLGMDAEVISTGLLREASESGIVNCVDIEETLGGNIAHLLRDCLRVRHVPSRVETLDDDSAAAVRQFCLAFHDIRAVVVELACQLDAMRHIHSNPRYRQQLLALETMQIYAPLAHALGITSMALELEDLGFGVLFPDSYSYIGSWLRSHWIDGNAVVDKLKDQLSAELKKDSKLQGLVSTANVVGRYKSRFSTMRKLLKDGRSPEEVHDVLGLRVILEPHAGSNDGLTERERGIKACYRAMEIATSIWREVPGRAKDYIENRKENGYESLHVAVNVSEQNHRRPPMEIQIRTMEMDVAAVSGEASHSLYKGGMTDAEQAKNLKLIMLAAANAAAPRFGEITGNAVGLESRGEAYADEDQIFKMFDKNQDGVINIEEFREVITELGADEADALELMQIVDLNTDGSVSADEFGKFRHQIQVHQSLAGVDRNFRSQLGSKLQGEDSSPETEESTPSIAGLLPEVSDDDVRETAGMVPDESSHPSSSNQSANDGDSANQTLSSASKTDVQDCEYIGSTGLTPDSQSLTAKPHALSEQLVEPAVQSSSTPNTADVLAGGVPEEKNSYPSSSAQSGVVSDIEGALSKDASAETEIQKALTSVRQSLADGNLVLARRLASKVSTDHPNSTKALTHSASVERKCGHNKAAGALYARAIDVLEFKQDFGLEYVRALQAWASLEAKIGNHSKARFLFTRSMTASEKGEEAGELRQAGVYGLHGWALLEERCGNWDKARDMLQRAASLQPGNAVVHQSRATLEARAHNYSTARVHFFRAVEAAPTDVKCWHAWAKFEASRENMEKARSLYKSALEVDPKNLHSLQSWAQCEARIGTPEARLQARKLFQRCADVDSKNVHCWQSWGILEENAGDYERARFLFKQGLKANAKSVPCLQAFAHMERKCGNINMAVTLLERALQVEPDNAACLMELGLVMEMLGNGNAALNLYKEAASIDKQRSAVKKRMFESRKWDRQAMGDEKNKNAGVPRPRIRGSSKRKSTLEIPSRVDGVSSDQLESHLERIYAASSA